ncbi:MAG: hypothetical protein AAGA69_03455 [Pseudomonadota bacterium]
MTGSPVNAKDEATDEFDIDFELDDLDDLDDEELQRLLEQDPALEEELRAIEAAEAAAAEAPAAEPVVEQPSEDHEASLPEVQDAEETTGDIDQETGLTALPATSQDMSVEEDDLPDPDDTAEFEETETAITPDAEEPEATAAEEVETAEDVVDDLDDLSFAPPVVESEGIPPAEVSVSEEEVDPSSLRLVPIPRINIHAFCQSDRITGLIEQAAQDRRLTKAHVTIHSGDAERAAEIYAQEASPNLILIEGGGQPNDLLNGLDQLANHCDPSTRVICVGDLNDIRLYRELMDRGVSDYLVLPRSPLQVISAIGDLYADPDAPAVGKSYVFVGARGGVGSSTVCHNAAWGLAQDFLSDTVLMDLDLAFGTASLDFEHDPSQGLAEALSAPERLDDVLLDRLLQKCTDRLSLFVAPNMLDLNYDHPAESYEMVVEMVRKTAPSVVIDLPHLWSEWARQTLQSADEIVITATPDLASFRNAKNLVESVKAQRTNDSQPILVLNQVGVPKRPEVPAEQFEEAIGITPLVTIPWDPVSFGTAATNAEAVLEAAPKSKSAAAFRTVAARLAGQEDKVTTGFSLKSLFSKKR